MKRACCKQAGRFSPDTRYNLSTYKQLTYEQGCQIEALNKSEFTQRVYQHIWEIKEVVAELNATPRKTLGF